MRVTMKSNTKLSPEDIGAELSSIGGLNRRSAIRQYCLECSEDAKDVRHCPVLGCSLFPYRSGRGKQDPKERDTAIKLECMSCMNYQPKEITFCENASCPLWEFRGYIRGYNSLNYPRKVPTGSLSGKGTVSGNTQTRGEDNLKPQSSHTDNNNNREDGRKQND